jgi:hypothetical protein
MKRLLLSAMLLCSLTTRAAAADKDGWISLFDGKSLDGWKANENPDTFKVEDGHIVVFGPRSHLFYDGPVSGHNFTNFHLKLDIMTFPKANSGVYFHSEWQDTGFPRRGFEVQVNNSHTDPKRGAGLYGIKDNYEAPAKDEEWYTMEIVVVGKHVTTKVNGRTIIEWDEPPPPQADTAKTDDVKADPTKVEQPKEVQKKQRTTKRLASGTFALQGHDPGSKIWYRNIFVKPLP